jgi:hypothetical protein
MTNNRHRAKSAKGLQRKPPDDIILSQLPQATKRQLWANIKTRNPAKAAVM